MSRCLPPWTLFVVSLGEGKPEQRSHLMKCAHCAARYREAIGVTELAAHVLREGPLPERAPARRPVWRPWSMAVAAAAAIVLTLVWRGVPDEARRQVAMTETAGEVPRLSLVHVSRVLFPPEGFPPSVDSDGVYLEAALQGEWPCEREAGEPDTQCEDEP